MSETSDLVVALEELSAWIVGKSSLRSLRELVSWIGPYLSTEATDELETFLPLEHPAQKAAEKAVAKILSAEERPTRANRQRRRVTRPSRSVDWGESYARAFWNPPLEYVEEQKSPRLDIPVMAALARQAQVWHRMLREYGDRYEERIQALETVLSDADTEWKQRTAGLDGSKLERIAQHDREAADQIRRGLYLWEGTVGEGNRAAFRTAIRRAVDCEKKDVDNDDTLLEVLCAWCVARVAVESGDSTSARDWQFRGDPVTDTGGDETLVLRLEDRKSGLRCDLRACKATRPRDCVGGEGVATDGDGKPIYLDRQCALRAAELGDAGGGYQPDLTLHFTHTDHPGRHLFAFGDAKNYEKSDLASAIKDTGTAYLFAYGALCGLPDENFTGSPAEIQTALRPPVTIFGRDDVQKVVGCAGDNIDQIKQVFGDQRRQQIPPIVLLGDQHYLGTTMLPETEQPDGREHPGTWSAPVLAAWFD